MLPLRALLVERDSLLLIDSSSTRIHVGLLRARAEPWWDVQPTEAGIGVFAATEALLQRSGLALSDIKAFAFCDGPGSVLGIRTAAVALRTWNVLQPRPLYSFCSLALLAHALRRSGETAPFSVIADARRDSWHCVTVDSAGAVSPLRRAAAASLVGPLSMPEGFRHWSTPPPDLRIVPYEPPLLFAQLTDIPLFAETKAPDAFLHEEPVYQTWTPQIHRAPA
jgi:tRNA threonylcarbamoyladenosine biosynthesis protein TsaB